MLLVLLLACTPSPPPEAPAGPLPVADLGTPSGAIAWRALDALDSGQYTLPGDDAAASSGAEVDGTFRLEGAWRDEGRTYGRMRELSFPLPFPCDMPRPNYAPLGARLYRGAAQIPWAGGLEAIEGSAWFVQDERVHLLTLESPEAWPVPAELRVPEIAAAVTRMHAGRAGLAPAAFVAMEGTVGPVTRPALFLPAPGVARFQVAIPADATLDLGAVILPDPLHGASGDGAVAKVEVNGDEVWTKSLTPGGEWADARVDLSAWAGTTVELTFRSDPGGDPRHDYVAFSSPTVRARPARPPRHVVVVGIDTLRWDALGVNGRDRDTSPEIDRWARGAVLFDQARAPAPRTRPSFRTALTGRYPLAALDAPTVASVLRDQGFRTAGFTANVHLVPRFGFNAGFEHWHYQNGARAEDQISRALAWMDEHQHEDTFVFLHLMDPHTWYNAPLPYGIRFTGARTSPRVPSTFDRWQIVQLTRRKALTPDDQALIRDRYDGEVAYTSASLERLFTAVDGHAGRTVTVLHSDHGEEFWDHGGFEHNHTLYDELVRALLAIRPPGGWGGGPHRVDAPVGLQDLVPTLLDLVGVPASARPPTDGLSLRPFVDAAAEAGRDALVTQLEDRPLIQGHLMFDRERWAVTWRGHKYLLHTAKGTEELYDLRADPGEQNDLAATTPAARLDEWRQALGRGTGWPVGPGWRVELRGRPRAPFEIVFDGPIAAAGIIDPEADRAVRANLEWGERPEVEVAEVGRVALGADHTVVLFQPGPKAEGQTLYVRCAAACPTGRFRARTGAEVPLDDGTYDVGPVTVRAWPGWVLEVGATDGDALAAPTDTRQLEELKVLGYIDGD